MVTQKQIENVLKTIPDPELGISVVDLGLIYAIEIDPKGNVEIRMTLTSIGCPLFNLIADPIKEKVEKIKGVKSAHVDLTFEPPWNMDKMSPEAKLSLGMM
jgi:metal-sulfur cluster biosynthetic enzyme